MEPPQTEPSLGFNWPWIGMILFLVFGAVVVWGAWNGKFSPERILSQDEACPELKRVQDQLTVAKKALEQKEEMLFRYENLGSEQAAAVKDQGDEIQNLLSKIGDQSQKIHDLIQENETLRKALKQALEDLATCRGKLMQCKAVATAKRLEHEFCNMTPGSMVLR